MTGKVTGKLFIISAPSGAGKTSLARALIANDKNTCMSISHTTRQQRAGEVHGEDYFFVEQIEFIEMVDETTILWNTQKFMEIITVHLNLL